MKLPDDIVVTCHCGKEMTAVMGDDSEILYMCPDATEIEISICGEDCNDEKKSLTKHYGQINVMIKEKGKEK